MTLADLFESYDRDRTGYVTPRKFRSVMAKFGIHSGLNPILKRFQSGMQVNYKDFLQFFEQTKQRAKDAAVGVSVTPSLPSAPVSFGGQPADYSTADKGVSGGLADLAAEHRKNVGKTDSRNAALKVQNLQGSQANGPVSPIRDLYRQRQKLHAAFVENDSDGAGRLSRQDFDRALHVLGFDTARAEIAQLASQCSNGPISGVEACGTAAKQNTQVDYARFLTLLTSSATSTGSTATGRPDPGIDAHRNLTERKGRVPPFFSPDKRDPAHKLYVLFPKIRNSLQQYVAESNIPADELCTLVERLSDGQLHRRDVKQVLNSFSLPTEGALNYGDFVRAVSVDHHSSDVLHQSGGARVPVVPMSPSYNNPMDRRNVDELSSSADTYDPNYDTFTSSKFSDSGNSNFSSSIAASSSLGPQRSKADLAKHHERMVFESHIQFAPPDGSESVGASLPPSFDVPSVPVAEELRSTPVTRRRIVTDHPNLSDTFSNVVPSGPGSTAASFGDAGSQINSVDTIRKLIVDRSYGQPEYLTEVIHGSSSDGTVSISELGSRLSEHLGTRVSDDVVRRLVHSASSSTTEPVTTYPSSSSVNASAFASALVQTVSGSTPAASPRPWKTLTSTLTLSHPSGSEGAADGSGNEGANPGEADSNGSRRLGGGIRVNPYRFSASTDNPLATSDQVSEDLQIRSIREAIYDRAGRKSSHIRNLWSSFDENRDGVLSYDEFRKGLETLGVPMTRDQFQQLTKVADRDQSGTIDYNEFVQVMKFDQMAEVDPYSSTVRPSKMRARRSLQRFPSDPFNVKFQQQLQDGGNDDGEDESSDRASNDLATVNDENAAPKRSSSKHDSDAAGAVLSVGSAEEASRHFVLCSASGVVYKSALDKNILQRSTESPRRQRTVAFDDDEAGGGADADRLTSADDLNRSAEGTSLSGVGGGKSPSSRHGKLTPRERKDLVLRRKIVDRLLGRTSQLKEMFRQFDTDHNGHVSRDEMRSGLHKIGVDLTVSEFERLFSYLDSDRSGEVDYEEFAHMMSGTSGLGSESPSNASAVQNQRRLDSIRQDVVAKIHERSKNVRDFFRRLDRNGDGLLSVDEFRSGLRDQGLALADRELDWLIGTCDRNGDGVVQYDEFVNALVRPASESASNSGSVEQRMLFSGSISAANSVDEDSASVTSGGGPSSAAGSLLFARTEDEVHELKLRKLLQEKLEGKLRNVQKGFRLFDRNSDGSVSYPEFRTALEGLGVKLSDSDFSLVVKRCDADADGTVDYQEFSRYFTENLETTGLDRSYSAPSEKRKPEHLRSHLTLHGMSVGADDKQVLDHSDVYHPEAPGIFADSVNFNAATPSTPRDLSEQFSRMSTGSFSADESSSSSVRGASDLYASESGTAASGSFDDFASASAAGEDLRNSKVLRFVGPAPSTPSADSNSFDQPLTPQPTAPTPVRFSDSLSSRFSSSTPGTPSRLSSLIASSFRSEFDSVTEKKFQKVVRTFSALDPAGAGRISSTQFRRALQFLGVKLPAWVVDRAVEQCSSSAASSDSSAESRCDYIQFLSEVSGKPVVSNAADLVPATPGTPMSSAAVAAALSNMVTEVNPAPERAVDKQISERVRHVSEESHIFRDDVAHVVSAAKVSQMASAAGSRVGVQSLSSQIGDSESGSISNLSVDVSDYSDATAASVHPVDPGSEAFVLRVKEVDGGERIFQAKKRVETRIPDNRDIIAQTPGNETPLDLVRDFDWNERRKRSGSGNGDNTLSGSGSGSGSGVLSIDNIGSPRQDGLGLFLPSALVSATVASAAAVASAGASPRPRGIRLVHDHNDLLEWSEKTGSKSSSASDSADSANNSSHSHHHRSPSSPPSLSSTASPASGAVSRSSVDRELGDPVKRHLMASGSPLFNRLSVTGDLATMKSVLDPSSSGSSGSFDIAPPILSQEKDRLLAQRVMKRARGQMRAVTDIFTTTDLKQSGCVSYREFIGGLKSLGVYLSDTDLVRTLQAFDPKSDGNINYREFAARMKLEDIRAVHGSGSASGNRAADQSPATLSVGSDGCEYYGNQRRGHAGLLSVGEFSPSERDQKLFSSKKRVQTPDSGDASPRPVRSLGLFSPIRAQRLADAAAVVADTLPAGDDSGSSSLLSSLGPTSGTPRSAIASSPVWRGSSRSPAPAERKLFDGKRRVDRKGSDTDIFGSRTSTFSEGLVGLPAVSPSSASSASSSPMRHRRSSSAVPLSSPSSSSSASAEDPALKLKQLVGERFYQSRGSLATVFRHLDVDRDGRLNADDIVEGMKHFNVKLNRKQANRLIRVCSSPNEISSSSSSPSSSSLVPQVSADSSTPTITLTDFCQAFSDEAPRASVSSIVPPLAAQNDPQFDYPSSTRAVGMRSTGAYDSSEVPNTAPASSSSPSIRRSSRLRVDPLYGIFVSDRTPGPTEASSTSSPSSTNSISALPVAGSVFSSSAVAEVLGRSSPSVALDATVSRGGSNAPMQSELFATIDYRQADHRTALRSSSRCRVERNMTSADNPMMSPRISALNSHSSRYALDAVVSPRLSRPESSGSLASSSSSSYFSSSSAFSSNRNSSPQLFDRDRTLRQDVAELAAEGYVPPVRSSSPAPASSAFASGGSGNGSGNSTPTRRAFTPTSTTRAQQATHEPLLYDFSFRSKPMPFVHHQRPSVLSSSPGL